MTYVYLSGFLLLTTAIVLLLRLTPEKLTEDLMRLVTSTPSLRDRALTATGKKKSKKITAELTHIRDALNATGKGNQFALVCAAALVLMVLGCVMAIAINNAFLIPVFAVALALLPFGYAKSTIHYYDKHVKDELETALSIITTSYIRSDDLVSAFR